MKYVLYKENKGNRDRLVCKKIDASGAVTLINNNAVLQHEINNFINDDFTVVIKGGNLHLYGKYSTFILRRFPEIIDCPFLTTLKQSVLTKIPERKLVPKTNNKKKKRSIFNNKGFITTGCLVGCSISALGLLLAPHIMGMPNDNEPIIQDKPAIVSEASHMDNLIDISSFSHFPTMQYNFVTGEYVLVDPVVALSNEEEPTKTIQPTPTLEPTSTPEPEPTFEEKSLVVRQRDYLTRDMLNRLLICMCNGTISEVNFNTSEEALNYLYENETRTYYEKMLIIMIRDGLSYEQLDDICAGVVAEGGDYYDEGYRVASVAYNRYHSAAFIRSYGEGLYTQFLAPNQFSVFAGDKTYLLHKGRIDSPGYQAAIDMFYSKQISTDYLSFRGWWVTSVPSNWEIFLKHGNKFGNHQADSDKVKLDYEIVFEEEMIEDSRECSEDLLPSLDGQDFVYSNSDDDISRTRS